MTDNATENAVLDASESYEDYWGTDEVFDFYLPDNKQFFQFTALDEGGKTKFQKMTNKGIRMNQRTQDAHIDVDPSDERHTLIIESVVGWKIMQKASDGSWSPLPCPTDNARRTKVIRDQILSKFNPKIIQDLEFEIRKKNPWMQDDQNLEQLYEEQSRIEELIKAKKQRDAEGNDSETR